MVHFLGPCFGQFSGRTPESINFCSFSLVGKCITLNLRCLSPFLALQGQKSIREYMSNRQHLAIKTVITKDQATMAGLFMH